MNPNDSLPHRKKLRIPDFDYSQPGAYYVSIVTQGRRKLFGQIVDGEMVLNDIGKMVKEVIDQIPDHYPGKERMQKLQTRRFPADSIGIRYLHRN